MVRLDLVHRRPRGTRVNPDELVAKAGGVLLDFDGPVCSIFAGYPAPEVAELMRRVLRANGGVADGGVLTEADPLEVLEYVAANNVDLLDTVEEALCAAELEAAASAEPTPDADKVIRHIAQMRIPLVVVSNNSAPAIEAYLRARDLSRFVDGVVGRSFAHPERMKPNPWPIFQAAQLVGVPVDQCILIGDSDTDVAAALAAGARCIGVANRPAKETTLPAAGAVATVTRMEDLLGASR
jgi:HAD superfamily hydrolase (TIGR01509 family)